MKISALLRNSQAINSLMAVDAKTRSGCTKILMRPFHMVLPLQGVPRSSWVEDPLEHPLEIL